MYFLYNSAVYVREAGQIIWKLNLMVLSRHGASNLSFKSRHIGASRRTPTIQNLPFNMTFQPTLLEGKVGIVTGAGSPHGIGRSLVLGLAAAGAKIVYATDINVSRGIASLQQVAKDSGSLCVIHSRHFDVTSEEQTKSLVANVLSSHGRLDFFFANAGVASFKSFADTDAEHYNKINRILQRAFFLAVKYASHAMSATSNDKTAPGGAIVATGSAATLNGSMADFSYSTAKAAIAYMVQSASVQLSATNIRVNAVSPGFVRTSLLCTSNWSGDYQDVNFTKEDAISRYDMETAPMRQAGHQYYYNRVTEPDEIANIGVFLVSDAASAINGQNVVADSGRVVAALGEAFLGPIECLKPL